MPVSEMLSLAITRDTCGGQPVSPGDVVVKFTYYGDANLDGNVDAEDESILASAAAALPAVAPILVITPTSEPTEGQPYTLSLSATYADNTPASDMISQWRLNFGDGNGVQTYNGQAVTATSGAYPAGTTSATVQITAVEANGQQIDDSQAIVLSPTPVSSFSGSYSDAGGSATISFNGQSSIASNYIIQRLDPGSTTWQTVGTVAADANGNLNSYSYTDTGLTGSAAGGDGGYLYRAAAESSAASGDAPGSPGVSTYTAATAFASNPVVPSNPVYDGTTATMQRTGVSGSWTSPILDSEGYAFPFQSGASDTFTVSNLPTHMSFNFSVVCGAFGDYNNDTLTFTGPNGTEVFTGPYINSTLSMTVPDSNTMRSASFTIKYDIPGAGRYWNLGTPLVNIGLGSVSAGQTSQLDVSGESYEDVSFSAPGFTDCSNVTLNVVNSDASTIAAMSPTVTLNAAGQGQLLVKGVSYGKGTIILQDAAGDEGILSVGDVYWGPGATSGEITEGATYNTPTTPAAGFTFAVPYPSVSPITLHYNTSGSTVPASMLGPLSSGTVTIPATTDPNNPITSTFVPFSVADDGKVAPTRVAVVNLQVPGVTPAPRAELGVLNNDTPTVTIDSVQDGANVTVDPEDDSSLLAPVNFSLTKDGTLNSSTFTWNPSQELIWLTDKVGTVGVDDLASLPGVTSDVGGDHYTLLGRLPTELWVQTLTGSTGVDGDSISLAVNVSKAATSAVLYADATPSSTGYFNSSGTIVEVTAATPVDPKTPTFIVGERITVGVIYVGPGTVPDPPADQFHWKIGGKPISSYEISLHSGTPVPLSDPSVNTNMQSISFCWYTPGTETINISGTLRGHAISLAHSINCKVVAPSSGMTITHTSDNPAVQIGPYFYNRDGDWLHFGAAGYADSRSDGISIDATVTEPVGYGTGNAAILQTAGISQGTYTSTSGFTLSSKGQLVLDNPHDSNPDSNSPIFLRGATATPPGVLTHLTKYYDSPSEVVRSDTTAAIMNNAYYTYIMFNPGLPGSIWVPLRRVKWQISVLELMGKDVAWHQSYTGKQTDSYHIYADSGSVASEPAWSDYYTDLKAVVDKGYVPG
jgi:hypothetical protein